MHKVCLHAVTYSLFVSYVPNFLSTWREQHALWKASVCERIAKSWHHCREEQLTIIEFLLGELSKLVNPRHIVLVTLVV